jgi:4-hydroxy-tetrahydrodipicolinate synthase
MPNSITTSLNSLNLNGIHQKIKGVGVALITPFHFNGEIDFKALEKLLDYTRDNGVDYYVVLGTTGEPVTLSFEERIKVFQFVAEYNQNRIPLVAGIGGNNTAEVIHNFLEFPINKYSAILSVSPYYNKPSQEGIFQHYETIAKASPLPIILYNVPARTGSNIEADTTLRLANQFQNIIGIKEASGNFDQINKITSQKPDLFQVISGDDAIAVPMISIGATGLISVLANSHPKDCSEMVRYSLMGDFKTARKYHQKLSNWIPILFDESNPTGVKTVLKHLQICEDRVRLPLVRGSENLNKKVEHHLAAFPVEGISKDQINRPMRG